MLTCFVRLLARALQTRIKEGHVEDAYAYRRRQRFQRALRRDLAMANSVKPVPPRRPPPRSKGPVCRLPVRRQIASPTVRRDLALISLKRDQPERQRAYDAHGVAQPLSTM